MAHWRLRWHALRQIVRHEGGFQAAEKIAAIAVVLALLSAVAVVFVGGGDNVGQAASNTIQHFITGSSGQASPGSATSGTITVASLTSGVVGVPNLLLAQVGGGQTNAQQQQPQQKDCGFLAFKCWDDAAKSAAGWVGDRASDVWSWSTARAGDVWNFLTSKEGIGAILGFIGAGIAVIAAVALGVFVGLPALAIAAIVVVALGLGALAGYLYVKITGRVDPWVILGLGFLVGGVAVIAGVWLAGGSAALASAWGTISGGLSTAWSFIARVGTTIARAAWTGITTAVRFVARLATTVARGVWTGITTAARFVGRWFVKLVINPIKFVGRQFMRFLNFEWKFKLFGRFDWVFKGVDLLTGANKFFIIGAIVKDILITGKPPSITQLASYALLSVLGAFAPAAAWGKFLWKGLIDALTAFAGLLRQFWPNIP